MINNLQLFNKVKYHIKYVLIAYRLVVYLQTGSQNSHLFTFVKCRKL